MNINLAGELGELLTRHHNALVESGMDGTLADTGRQLLREALAQHANGVLISSSARRAYTRTSSWVVKRMSTFCNELKAELDHQLLEIHPEQCPFCGQSLDEPHVLPPAEPRY